MKQPCSKCANEFDVSEKHLDFYKRASPKFSGRTFDLPQPTLCPDCRQQRRMAWRSERDLFIRKCSKTEKRMVSMYVPDTSFPVYNGADWWDEANDAIAYGQPIDFSRPVFPQIKELQDKVPRMQMFTFAVERLVNSEYTNCTGDLKDCYMIFCSGRNERCFYSTAINDCYECFDCLFVRYSTCCYECIDVGHSNSLFFARSCEQCRDSAFLFDCRSCSNCLFCAGLRQQEYHIFNEPCSKEEYEKARARIFDGTRAAIAEARKRYAALLAEVPRRAISGVNNENSTGDFISSTKNCEYCFDTVTAEDCSFCTWFFDGNDCMDFYSWGEAELCYEVSGGGDGAYRSLFSSMGSGLRNCCYTDHCQYCQDCFACVGLKNKKHCIFNVQYTPDEYEELAAQLAEHMQQTGEWGEFFPATMAPFGYNHSSAKEYFPLSKEAALESDFVWSDYVPPNPDVTRVIEGDEVPACSHDVPDDLLDCAIRCRESAKLFRIQKEELDFYRQHRLPIPDTDHNVRHASRLAMRNPRRLWLRMCAQCNAEIQTSYDPERPEIVYCESCYNDAIY